MSKKEESKVEVIHQPVLLREVLEVAAVKPGDRWIDGTFGRGGHTEALLKGGAEVLALDRDAEAEKTAAALEKKWPGQLTWKQGNFEEIKKWSRQFNWKKVNGVLLDLGVCSDQIEAPERGLSFRLEGPLDMRMDRRESLVAADLVNKWEQEPLARIFYEEGGERNSRRVARAIIERRKKKPFTTTTDLAEVVAQALGRSRTGGIHPATKVFQALRIAVNREREALLAVLPQATELLETGGTLAVISFHSGEDRVVKKFLKDHSAPYLDTPEQPQSFINRHCYFSGLRRFMPSEEEIERNPRARSARLRVVTRNATPFEMEEIS